MTATLAIRPWADPIVDTLGHDPRSAYVETFWLPTLGPTTVLLLRRLAATFDHRPEGSDVDVAELSHALGLGVRTGAQSPLRRSFGRLCQFDLARPEEETTFAVRRAIPPVNLRHVRRLPAHLQDAHAAWTHAMVSDTPMEIARRRARRLALCLLEQGDEADHVEHVLLSVGFHPSLCRDSAQWAYERHVHAFAEAQAAEHDPVA